MSDIGVAEVVDRRQAIEELAGARQTEAIADRLEHAVESRFVIERKIKARAQQADHRVRVSEHQAALEVLRHPLVAVAQMRVELAHVGLEPVLLIAPRRWHLAL